MAKLLSFIGGLSSGSDGPPASFGFSTTRKVDLPFPSVFELHEGICAADKSKASIWIFSKTKQQKQDHNGNELLLEFARNHVKVLKSLRHPLILKPLASVETNAGIYLATEHVTPLTRVDEVSWLAFQLCKVLSFLHNTAKVVHGLLCPATIFVTVADDQIRLSGFDCSVAMDEATAAAASQQFHPLVAQRIFNRGRGLAAGRQIDTWGLAATLASCHNAAADLNYCVGPEVVVVSGGLRDAEESAANLRDLVNKLLSRNVDLEKLVQTHPCFTHNRVVAVLAFLEEINLRAEEEKEAFFATLAEDVENIPIEVQISQVFPRLLTLLDYGGGRPMLVLPAVLAMLGIFAASPQANRREEIYRQKVIPLIMKLLKCPDRTIRFNLLQHLESYEKFLTAQDVEGIFEHIRQGAMDSSAMLREATVKSLVFFLPKCPKRQVHEKAAQLLLDTARAERESATIRVNVCIVFGKLALNWHPTLRVRVLAEAFGQALADGFPLCRSTAMRCISLCVRQHVFKPEEIASKLMKPVLPLLLDTDVQIRREAFDCLQLLLDSSRAELLPPTEEKETEAEAEAEAETEPKPSAEASGQWSFVKKTALDFYEQFKKGSAVEVGAGIGEVAAAAEKKAGSVGAGNVGARSVEVEARPGEGAAVAAPECPPPPQPAVVPRIETCAASRCASACAAPVPETKKTVAAVSRSRAPAATIFSEQEEADFWGN